MEVSVRLEQPGEQEQVSAIVAEAFGFDGTDRLLAALRESSPWRDLSFVAEIEGNLVAHISFTRGWVDAPKELVEVLIRIFIRLVLDNPNELFRNPRACSTALTRRFIFLPIGH